MRRLLNISLAILFLGFVSFYLVKNSKITKLNLKEESFILLVERGETINGILNQFKKEELYSNSKLGFYLMRIFVGHSNIEVGEYEFNKGDTIFTVISKIKNKDKYYRQITFIEGGMVFEYLNQINSAYGLIGEIEVFPKEGYFMPGTYNYLYGETKNSIIKRAEKDMLNFVKQEFSKVAKEGFYLKNIHEVLTLASVVEKEVGTNDERDLIAGVFYNRLQKNMRLQSDPTTIYEITKGKFKLDRPVTFKDLWVKGDYNTYRIGGLPKTPIASPSKASILAVLYPAKTDYLFFVLDGSGGHVFTKTFEEHKIKADEYRHSI